MKFYGVSGMSMTKELWNKLVISKLVSKIGQSWKGTDQINLTEFYSKTRPQYIVAHCMWNILTVEDFGQYEVSI